MEKLRQGLENLAEKGIIHPDFRMEINRFYQNHEWDSENGEAELKVIFSFNDPKLLDECPYVTKISLDLKGDYKYFGVAYGGENDKEGLQSWAKKFTNSKLLTFGGEFIEKIS